MAAALDYCMRGVAVPLALLVQPDLEFAAAGDRTPAQPGALREALRLIDRTIALHRAGRGRRLRVRPRCSASPRLRCSSSTAVSPRNPRAWWPPRFSRSGPSLIGWSLIEILSRSLFALDRPWPPVIAASSLC